MSKPKKPNKTLTVANPEYVEWMQKHGKQEFIDAIEIRSGMLVGFTGNHKPFAAYEAAVAEKMMYFPQDYDADIADTGHWILVTAPPHTEVVVSRFSIWYAMPEVRQQRNGFALHLAQIITPDGSLWLWPHEYRKIDIAQYMAFIDDGYSLRFLGGHDALPTDKLHYVMSRGIPKQKAVELLLPSLTAPDVCWLEPTDEVKKLFT